MKGHVWLILILVSILAGGILSGCGQDLPAEEPEQDKTTTQTAEQDPEPPTDIPYYTTEEVSVYNLKNYSLRELSLRRNTIYARAGNVFRKKWLNDYFSRQPWYKPTGLDMSKLSATDIENARRIGSVEVSIPKEELKIRLDGMIAESQEFDHYTFEEEELIEISLLSRALGIDVPDGLEYENRNPLDYPSQLNNLLTVDQLSDFSRRDLRILRNTIFARRGRPFKSEMLNLYFERMAWYKPTPTYSDDRLTDIDLKNIKIIRSVEQQMGGQLTESEHRQMGSEWHMAA